MTFFSWLQVQLAPREKINALWGDLAYAARYGRQPISELKQLPRKELLVFIQKIHEIVEQENTVPGGEEHG
jgi:hypothetical protein